MTDKDFQQKLLNQLRANEDFSYENASIFTILLDLIQGNGEEEVLRVFNEVVKYIKK